MYYKLTESGELSWDILGAGAGWHASINDRTCVVTQGGGAQVSFIYKGMRRSRSGINETSRRLSRMLEDKFPVPGAVPDGEFFSEFVKGLTDSEEP